MKINEVIDALEQVKMEFNNKSYSRRMSKQGDETKGGYFRVGNVAIKIAELTELSQLVTETTN